MAKWAGKLGYITQVETDPGIWEESVIERSYCGELLRNNRRWQTSGSINDEFTVTNEISLVADPFATANFQHIKYATYMGTSWKVTSANIQYPRITLELGGVYNG